ncbi:DNA-binding MarR family transcriptional regulator/GNAT superfamily N-acetyltransferase [Thermocatellispora tengchongensis]|uniref:DNA-binding MarR family transcriptional regulator/GNAT superfamily N-acetyltransferase n=1 Tax=Thermocatellispora tengchongensis TaxID=1073253 RepID=A0A840P6G8_9ACTN|nr:helix-turn-helix domain-containing GNAT family N-acetyltransferase [Thermocatellispora tengchongensis]MBB5131605.1 DNA-binding MarR family transcriptional regulator/GNAT superfamily N-acetyltransferase [Thermocatellispora tengchongensis]
MQDRVAEIRAFNRFYTGVIGLLQGNMHDTPYSLTEARVLFELGTRGRAEAAELRRLLGLDAGYLSRILTRFESEGLVAKERSAADARRQVITLTAAGREMFGVLDRRSVTQIAELLAKVPEDDQDRLVAAMRTIQRVLGDTGRPAVPYVIRPPRAGDLGWVVHRHGALYAREYGWGREFEALVARIVADYVANLDPARESAWIAEVDGEPVGCVFCVRKDDETAQLRLLLVDPAARGMGIGARLVDECLRFAREAGYKRIMLWTRDALASARKIYLAAGFELVEEYPGEEAGKPVVEQIYEREV